MTGLRRAIPLLLGLAVSCTGRRPREADRALIVTGDGGEVVRLPRPARRIVSLNPATTELLFAIGAGSQLVGRTRWCDWPPAATRIQNVGDGFPPNVEAVLATHPDLAILYPTGVNRAPARRLGELGIPVVALRTDRLEDLVRAVRSLGVATGHERVADSVAAGIEAELEGAARAVRDRPTGPTVVILSWTDPPLALGAASYLHEVVELAGGHDAFGNVARASVPTSIEVIANLDPDVILAGDAAVAALKERPEWRVVRAVREGRVLPLDDPGLARPGLRALAAIAPLRARLARVANPLPEELSR